MESATRVEDEIAYGYGMLAMVSRALVGVAAGIAVVGALGSTGGLAAVAIATRWWAVAWPGTGSRRNLRQFDLPEPTTGVLAMTANSAVSRRSHVTQTSRSHRYL